MPRYLLPLPRSRGATVDKQFPSEADQPTAGADLPSPEPS